MCEKSCHIVIIHLARISIMIPNVKKIHPAIMQEWIGWTLQSDGRLDGWTPDMYLFSLILRDQHMRKLLTQPNHGVYLHVHER